MTRLTLKTEFASAIRCLALLFVAASCSVEASDSAVLAKADPESVGFSSERLAALNAAIHRSVDDGEFAGVVTLLARHGKIVSEDVYGSSNIAAGATLA